MSYSKGISWINDCRIPFTTEDTENINFNRPRVRGSVNEEWVLKQAHDYTDPNYKEYNTQGRFTPQLLVCDDMLNDGSVSKNGDIKPHKQKEKTCFFTSEYVTSSFVSDKGTNSRYYDLDKWFNKIINEL